MNVLVNSHRFLQGCQHSIPLIYNNVIIILLFYCFLTILLVKSLSLKSYIKNTNRHVNILLIKVR